MKATFVRMQWENESQTIATFFFRPASAYRYEAGQYAVLSVPHSGYDSRGTSRTMTLSSSPDDPLLGFTMRIMSSRPVRPGQPAPPRGDAGSTYKRALLKLHPGDVVTVFESLGDLVLPLDSSIPLVFIAGGVGIASFTGMTAWLTEHRDIRRLQLYQIVARPGDVIMQPLFDAYAAINPLHLTRSIYTPSVKRLTGAAVKNAAAPGSLFYISGTEQLAEVFLHGLLEAGIPRSNIVFDYFDGYSEL